MWVETKPEQLDFDEDDLAAIALLNGPYNRQEVAEILKRGAPELDRGTEYGGNQGMALGPEPLMLAPMCALGISGIAFGAMKAQNRGRISRKAHEWIDLVLGFDLYPHGKWSAMFTTAHLPLAIAAGIRVEAIEAVRDGKEEQLDDEERLRADFVRKVYKGEMTEDTWRAMVDLEGSEKGVVELVCLIMLLFVHIRCNQAFGVAGDFGEDELDVVLQSFRDGTREPTDVAAYEAVWARMPWPPAVPEHEAAK